jgi:hypothetical protein
MPRYFTIIWLICIIIGILWTFEKFGVATVSVPFLLFTILTGFLLSMSVALIIHFIARIIGSRYDPLATRFDWRDDD